MKILIITGGLSSERTVSLSSAKFVNIALRNLGYKTKIFDLKKGLNELKNESKNYDILFPVLHGEEGEGGSLHKFLVTLKKPIVGTRNYKGLREAWYKISFKKYCDKNSILTPPWKKVKKEKDVLNFGFPSVLKSTNGGSSKEVVILKREEDLKSKACQKLLSSDSPLFVERYINGIEATVGILNNEALPVMEIVPPKGKWFDYKNKYSGETKEIPNAPTLSEGMKKKLQKITVKIHKGFNLDSYSRTDFIIDNNKAYVLEINTIPGLTKESLLPKIAKSKGIESFEEFIEELVKKAY